MLELVEVTLVDRALDEIADVAQNFLRRCHLIFLGQMHDFIALMRPNHLIELIVALPHLFVLVKVLLRRLLLVQLFLFRVSSIVDVVW